MFTPTISHIRAVQWRGDPAALDELSKFRPGYSLDFGKDHSTGLDTVLVNYQDFETIAYQDDWIMNLAGHLVVWPPAVFICNFTKAGRQNAAKH